MKMNFYRLYEIMNSDDSDYNVLQIVDSAGFKINAVRASHIYAYKIDINGLFRATMMADVNGRFINVKVYAADATIKIGKALCRKARKEAVNNHLVCSEPYSCGSAFQINLYGNADLNRFFNFLHYLKGKNRMRTLIASSGRY